MSTDSRYQKVLDRDSRYDGVFFFAVKTTGIVCRPSCPAMRPLERNVSFYDSLDEALHDGFRVCKRCKPEQFVESMSESTTLLESESIEEASRILGVGDRHLRRLTHVQVGTSPHQLLIGRRILTAKNLLSSTSLPVVDIAFSSGFQSLRQFNDSFKKHTRITPSHYRRTHKDTSTELLADAINMTLRLPFQKPFEWQPLKNALLAHMVPGLERIDEESQTLTRLIHTGSDRYVPIKIDLSEPTDYLVVVVTVLSMDDIDEVVRTIKRVFDLDSSPGAVQAILGRDSIIGALVHAHPGLRVCGMFSPFELLINTIIGQQVSVLAARTFSERLVKHYGNKIGSLYTYPSAETLLAIDPLRMYEETKLNHKKIATIRAVCRLLVDGFELAKITSSAAARETLLSVKGIGPWTVEYVALRGLGDPDGFPSDDLFIKRLLGVKTARDAERIAEKWRPYRGYATMQLWTKGTYE